MLAPMCKSVPGRHSASAAEEIEVTPEMVEAGYETILGLCRLWDEHDEAKMRMAIRRVFLSMLAAAPESQSPL
jgi:hypothetical protein